jgi:Copper type II ascorbate-dependent monooxygenase, C-terminal domain
MTQKQSFFLLFILLGSVFSACEKTIDYNPKEIPDNFVPPAAPAPGAGYQMHMPAFPIPPQFEREFFCRLPLNNPEDLYATGFEVKMRPGTHHLILYNFKNQNDPNLPPMGVLRDQNLANGDIGIRANVVNSAPLFQATGSDSRIDLPPGYAFKIPKNASFDLNSHYFNKTDVLRYGEVYANIYGVPQAQVKHLCEVAYKEPEELLIKPKDTTVVVTDFMAEKETHYVMLTSHYHKRGKKFEVRIVGGPRNGEQVYYSEDYEHPLWKTFQPELVLKPGEGLRTIVTYENETNRSIPFGVTSEDEMNIMIGFYYEK